MEYYGATATPAIKFIVNDHLPLFLIKKDL
jgi:hypothetical protein